MAESAFLKDLSYYQRNLDPIGQYIDQTAYYLSLSTNKPIDECKTFVINRIKSGKMKGIRNPVVRFFERGDNLDTAPAEMKLSEYIQTAVDQNLIMAPTATCYVHPDIERSLLVDFVDKNVKDRSVAKKISQKAEAEGDMILYINKHNEQANAKMYNNSLSGAFVAVASVFNNPSAHSSLTSITRTVSSLGNATNEKIISGNRHYHNPTVTLSNLISLCQITDLKVLDEAIQEYNLVYPTVEDVIQCVKYSSDFYWRDNKAFKPINDFVRKMSPIERAAVVYVSDLYHIRLLNPEFVRVFLTKLATKVQGVHFEDAVPKLYKFDEAIVNYAHQICLTEARGRGKDYAKMPYQDACTIYGTCLHIEKTIEEYRSFFNAFFLTRNMPCSSAYLPEMVRRSVVLSDTDSTMFSVDDYVKWYFDELKFTDEAFGIAGGVVFLATQCIAHSLAILSANAGMARDKIFTLSMKPEFIFPVFAQTSVSKHYYTFILGKEGSIYPKMKMEIKGVHLKSSAAPVELIKGAHLNMENLLYSVYEGRNFSIKDSIKRVAEIERRIKTSLLNGESTYYKRDSVKQPGAYSSPDPLKTPYVWHLFWREVFEPKYGRIEEPIYTTIKIPTVLVNKSSLQNWVGSIQDPALKARLDAWLRKTNKTKLPTIYISKDYVESHGIPIELVPVIDHKRIVLDLTNIEHIVLESQGYFHKPGFTMEEMGF